MGIDSSAGAVDVSNTRGVQTCQAEVGQPPDALPLPSASFDTALLLGNNLGLLSSSDVAGQVLDQIGNLLTDDGCIVGSSMDPHQRPAQRDLDYMTQNQNGGRLPGQYRLRLRYKMVASAWFDYLFLSLGELTELLSHTGGWEISQAEAQGPWYSVQLVRK